MILQWNPVSCITGNSMSSHGKLFSKKWSQLHHLTFDILPQEVFFSEIQPIAWPETVCPAMRIIFWWNPASCMTKSSMSSYRNDFPIKSSQLHYPEFHIQPCKSFLSEIQPSAWLEIACPATEMISKWNQASWICWIVIVIKHFWNDLYHCYIYAKHWKTRFYI